MYSEQIYEIISGKLMKILENQPNEIYKYQALLDEQISSFKVQLSNKQIAELDSLLETYTEYITLTNNFYFECGFKIGEKFSNVLKD